MVGRIMDSKTTEIYCRELKARSDKIKERLDSQGWKKPGFKGTPTPNYMRHDFTDYENNIAYYCTFGNGCVYCRYAPHARNVEECIFVISKPYRS